MVEPFDPRGHRVQLINLGEGHERLEALRTAAQGLPETVVAHVQGLQRRELHLRQLRQAIATHIHLDPESPTADEGSRITGMAQMPRTWDGYVQGEQTAAIALSSASGSTFRSSYRLTVFISLVSSSSLLMIFSKILILRKN